MTILTFVFAVHEPSVCSLQFLLALRVLALHLVQLSRLLIEQFDKALSANNRNFFCSC